MPRPTFFFSKSKSQKDKNRSATTNDKVKNLFTGKLENNNNIKENSAINTAKSDFNTFTSRKENFQNATNNTTNSDQSGVNTCAEPARKVSIANSQTNSDCSNFSKTTASSNVTDEPNLKFNKKQLINTETNSSGFGESTHTSQTNENKKLKIYQSLALSVTADNSQASTNPYPNSMYSSQNLGSPPHRITQNTIAGGLENMLEEEENLMNNIHNGITLPTKSNSFKDETNVQVSNQSNSKYHRRNGHRDYHHTQHGHTAQDLGSTDRADLRNSSSGCRQVARSGTSVSQHTRDDLNENKKKEKKIGKFYHCIKDLIDSEKVYKSALDCLLSFYKNPLYKDSKYSNILSNKEKQLIFGNISNISIITNDFNKQIKSWAEKYPNPKDIDVNDLSEIRFTAMEIIKCMYTHFLNEEVINSYEDYLFDFKQADQLLNFLLMKDGQNSLKGDHHNSSYHMSRKESSRSTNKNKHNSENLDFLEFCKLQSQKVVNDSSINKNVARSEFKDLWSRPWQRCTRYKMLVEAFLKYAFDDNMELEIKKTLQAARDMADSHNKIMKEGEVRANNKEILKILIENVDGGKGFGWDFFHLFM